MSSSFSLITGFNDEEEFVTEPLTLTLRDERISDLPKSSIYRLRSTASNPLLGVGYAAKSSYKSSGGVAEIGLERVVITAKEALHAVEAMRKVLPELISSTQVSIARRRVWEMLTFEDPSCHAVHNGYVYQVLSGACSDVSHRNVRTVQLLCSTVSLSCELSITAS